MSKTIDGRLAYADLLRCAAMLAVIVLHVSGGSLEAAAVGSPAFQVLNVYDSLAHWCVPVFVMLSGMFLLDPKHSMPLSKLFFGHILRIAVALVVWGTAYALVSHVAADVLPPVVVLDLPRAAIRIINQVRRFAERHRERELLDIAEDGVISPEERPLFDQIMEELHDLVQAIMELGLSEEGDGGHGERKRGIPGQPGADSGGIPRQGDPVSERDRPVVTYGQQNGQGELPDEGRRCAGGKLLDLRGQSGPRHVVGIKKERPEAATSKRSVRGLASKSANNSKVILSHFARKCKPHTAVREGVTP